VRTLTTATRVIVAGGLVATAVVGLRIGTGHLQAQTATQTISCPAPGFANVVVAGIAPTMPLMALTTVPNPVFPVNPLTGAPALRDDLVQYIADPDAAIRLGKALFWDMQAGSDNKVACATCHFQAGADRRDKNQLSPGANGAWEAFAPNRQLVDVDFPFTSPATGDTTDNIAGSQGVRKSTYAGLSKSGAELTTAVADTVFSENGKNVRQVTGMNTPSTINAVFNHRNFFNGRAQPEFNGVNPWGSRDGQARVWMAAANGTVASIDVHIANASLASQAVGPPLNPVEMSAAGRTFPDLGRKMLALKPLGLQKVDSSDSALGGLADSTKGAGLKTTYSSLIKQAFQPAWWNATKTVTINGKSYSLLEANFSLYWGLSIMLYESTLVSDRTPMDQYLASRVFQIDPLTGLPAVDANGVAIVLSDNQTLLDQVVNRLAAENPPILVTRDQIITGLALFERPLPPLGTTGNRLAPAAPWGVGCNLCHVGAETTSASVRNLTAGGLEAGDIVFKNSGFDIRMERMFMGVRTTAPPPPDVYPPVPTGTDVITYDPASYAVNATSINGTPVSPFRAPSAVYDAGWYNIGVRRSAEDPGVGGTGGPGNLPLSWTQFFQTTLPNPSQIKVPGGGLGCATSPPGAPIGSPFAGEVLNPLTGLPLLSGGLLKSEDSDVAGSFKTLSLRNVELNGPYFHNGGKATLKQVVEFYDQGGDFSNATISPLIRPLGLSPDQTDSLVAFLLALTDERVRFQRAPFDHPQLILPKGADSSGNDIVETLPAVGAGGSATAVPRFLGLSPFAVRN
jgi:cytochrome c peroxidase